MPELSSATSDVYTLDLLYSVQKSEEEWRAQLSPEQFRILRKKGTEMAGTGEYDKKVRQIDARHQAKSITDT